MDVFSERMSHEVTNCLPPIEHTEDKLKREEAGYTRVLSDAGVELSDEEWERTTHPDDWTVITTVAWVVVGDAQLASAASGEALQSVGEFDAAVLGGNPVAAWRGTAVDASERVCDDLSAATRRLTSRAPAGKHSIRMLRAHQ